MGGRQHRRLSPDGARLAVIAASALVFALVVWGLLGRVESRILGLVAAASLAWAGQVWYVGWRLDPRPAARQLLGVANLLTLSRGALFAVVAGFVVVPPGTDLAWVPALAYGCGVGLDYVDGTVARTVGEETAVGQRLDMAVDTFGFVAAPLVAVLWGQLPVWYLSLSAARYLYRGALLWRRHSGRPVFDAPDSNLGRYLAGVQMCFLTVALAPAVPAAVSWALAPGVLAPSLAVFVRDYLAVAGHSHSTARE